MASEKNFENRVKRFLQSKGIYPLGTPRQKMLVPPIGYWEKRWGGGTFTKTGLPDMHIVVKGYSLDAELKVDSVPSEQQMYIISQINNSTSCIAFVLCPTNKVDKLKDYVSKYDYPNVAILGYGDFKDLIERFIENEV